MYELKFYRISNECDCFLFSYAKICQKYVDMSKIN